MSEFIDREKAIAKIKAAYCCDCNNYGGVKCRACQLMDAMDVLEDELAMPDSLQSQWRKTAECPPTEADANAVGMVLAVASGYIGTRYHKSAETWPFGAVALLPKDFPIWMPLPKLPKESNDGDS